MPTTADQRAAALRARFEAAGAVPVMADILQPAGQLLDLYGEDLRARAYVTQDPVRGELMMRPDFTVPVVQQHLAAGGGTAAYTYAGPVFRKQEAGTGRANEYLQVGLERIGDPDPAAAEAALFAAVAEAVAGAGLDVATGDIGLLRAAVAALETSAVRKAALLRHIWRPRRFRRLLERYTGRTARPAHHGRLAAADVPGAAPEIGLRSAEEVRARIAALAEEAAAPPLPTTQADVLDDILDLRAPMPLALERLWDFAVDLPGLGPALDRMAARIEALAAAGVAVEALTFEASFGRTTMEYYDGFVFGFYAPSRPDLPAVATGGRYDALTRALGGADAPAAVGAVIRPALLVALEPEAA